ncbi:MAG: hypothetical protein J6B70_02995 [Oscillospiraceae bacterium]|nr:hypothetical protein [Oscillospiraceae bacterium]
MKLISMQIALFAQDLISRPDLLMNEINDKLGNIFDTMPTILNLPADVPAEIPLAQIRSKDGVYALNISRGRIDLIITPSFQEDKTPQDMFKQYKPIVDKYYKTSMKSVPIKRIGIIFTLFEPSNTNVQVIYEKYLKEKYRSDSMEVTVHTNNQILNLGVVYNNIRNVQAAVIHVGKEDHTGVVIQLDTNNVPSKEVTLTSEMVANIISHAAAKLKPSAVKELI